MRARKAGARARVDHATAGEQAGTDSTSASLIVTSKKVSAGAERRGRDPVEAAAHGDLDLPPSAAIPEKTETPRATAIHHPAGLSVATLEDPEPQGASAPQEVGERRHAERELSGLIEIATSTAIKGWAWDSDNPTRRVQLELVEEGARLASAVADVERADLADIGIGDGRHGFLMELVPGLLSDERPHVLDLRCSETGAALRGSPIVVTPPRTPFEWCLDSITDAELAGWVMVRNEPARHCVVVLREGGRVLAQAMASVFRRDLLAAGVGDGCYGFSLRMPHSLLDGEEHLLEVVEMDFGLRSHRAANSVAFSSRQGGQGVGRN